MKQSVRNAVMGLFSGLLLAGCATYNVTDATWSHPGYAAMAPKALHELSATTGYSVRYASFHGSDGTLLYGLLLTKPGNKITILNFDGNVFQTGTGGLESGRMFESVGVNAFLVDYRGYGMSQGDGTQISPAVSESDALAAYDFLRAEPGVRGSAIVVEGLSLGSFFAPYVANHRPVSGLVLESTATNASDWIHNQVPWYAAPFIRIHIAPSVASVSNISELERYHGPLLLLVGSKDQITPPRFAQALYEKSATPKPIKVLYIANGERHGTVLLDSTAARKAYATFLQGIVEAKRQANSRPVAPAPETIPFNNFTVPLTHIRRPAGRGRYGKLSITTRIDYSKVHTDPDSGVLTPRTRILDPGSCTLTRVFHGLRSPLL